MSLFPSPSLTDSLPLQVALVTACDLGSLNLAAALAPWRASAQLLGHARLQYELVPLPASPSRSYDLVLLIGDFPDITDTALRELHVWRQAAPVTGLIAGAVVWGAQLGWLDGLRIAFPFATCPDAEPWVDTMIVTPHLYVLDQPVRTCCGGAAGLDFSIHLLTDLFGRELEAELMQMLNIGQLRPAEERQKLATQVRFGALQPKLAAAIELMNANIEEPLSADDIAQLSGVSRRQLERLFKQYLGSVPSRYYLELRLQRARRLLLESNQSIVQVGLMCGFSSGSHFSTAYGSVFGLTPREERQRRLQNNS